MSFSWCRRKDVQLYPGWNPLFTLNEPYIINFRMDLSCFYIALQFMRSMAQFTPTYSLQRHNLPRTGGKLCHETTFFLNAIFLKQFISDLKLLLPGMHHILKYTYIFHLVTLLSWPHFKVTLSKKWQYSPHSPLPILENYSIF